MLFSRTPKPASFAKIRMQILSRWLLNNEKNCSVVALTSRLPGEGVSTVTLGLTRSFSATDTGKILLLNASRKHPRKAKVLDLSKQDDLSDLSDYVTKDKKYGFETIRVAHVTQSNYGMSDGMLEAEYPVPDIQFDDDGTIMDGSLDSEADYEQTRKLFRILRKTYDIILVDAGALTNAIGTFWLLNSDVNILIIDCSRTTSESLEHQQREFENSKINIGGSILNKRKFPIPRSLYWLVR